MTLFFFFFSLQVVQLESLAGSATWHAGVRRVLIAGAMMSQGSVRKDVMMTDMDPTVSLVSDQNSETASTALKLLQTVVY